MTRPPHQLIYTHGGGRLGNQVIRFAHWIAWARANEGEVEVVNLAFWPFARYFEVWRDHPGCLFPLRPCGADWLARRRARLPDSLRSLLEERSRLPRIVQAAGRWLPGWQAIALDIPAGEALELDDPAVLARIARSPVTTCSGWKIATWNQVARQEAELRTWLRPAPEFLRLAGDFLGEIRRQHDVVIGVFVRQSDYREWHEGRFHFPSECYAGWMRQLRDLHPGRRVAFVIASEESQDPAAFAGLPCHFATGTANAGGHWFESWVELARCDCIVSPPSTFSATAAFLGRIPLWPVLARDQVMAFDQVLADGLVGAARHPVFSLAVK
jgi:hypothetical protein